MRITIVYDNEIYKKHATLQSDWGFSCFIQTKHNTILFDTGAKGHLLLHNMEKLHTNPYDIDTIVISHEHWDHNGGLNQLIPYINDITIYRIQNDTKLEKKKQIQVNEPFKIAENIYSTGKLPGSPVDEQSIILKTQRGCYVITGCSHSGVDHILHAAENIGKINGIIGGFHGFDKLDALSDIPLIIPCHCTQRAPEILDMYPEKSRWGYAGMELELGEHIALPDPIPPGEAIQQVTLSDPHFSPDFIAKA